MRNSHGRNGRRYSTFARTITAQGGRIAGAARELGRVAVHGAGRAVSSLGNGGQRVVRAVKRSRTRVQHYISANPLGSVLIALGIGAIFGFLMRRRRPT